MDKILCMICTKPKYKEYIIILDDSVTQKGLTGVELYYSIL